MGLVDTPVVIFWGLMLAGIAIVMLLVGGNEALQGLQNLIIVSALPFTFVLFLMLFSFWKDLQTDPIMLRHRYGEEALNQAVKSGVAEHGDDFGLNVRRAEDGTGAGADFDSSDPAYTNWYQRRDEDGQEIEYDYTAFRSSNGHGSSTPDAEGRPEEQEDYARS
ncbi:MAG: BCCT family transporter [Ornithinimicrobium sp.]|uniref:BCCT family transporter n=1 Tax=Ornithinimicrobium sp. TaxID=1977084 RepID=UPI003D9AD59B